MTNLYHRLISLLIVSVLMMSAESQDISYNPDLRNNNEIGFQSTSVGIDSYGPPEISISPDSIYTSMRTGDEITKTITISNIGNFPLEWNADHSVKGITTGMNNYNIFVYRDRKLVDMLNEHPDLQATYDYSYPKDLNEYQVLFNNYNKDINPKETLEWIKKGGIWIGVGLSVRIPLNLWENITGTFGSYTWEIQSLDISAPSHWLAKNIDWNNVEIASGPLRSMNNINVTDKESTTIVSVNNSAYGKIPLLVEKNYGKGKIILLNCWYDNYNDLNHPGTADLIRKVGCYAIKIASNRNIISIDSKGGKILTGNSNDLAVVLNAQHKNPGRYFCQLDINSNDPTSEIVEVPVVVDVLSAPIISGSPDTVRFKNTFLGAKSYEIFTVANNGADTMFVNSVFSSDASVKVKDIKTFVPPYKELKVQAEFVSFVPGYKAGYIGVVSNDAVSDTLKVPFTGKCIEPPVFELLTDSFKAKLVSGSVVSKSVKVTNSGISDLNLKMELRDHPNIVFSGNDWAKFRDRLEKAGYYTSVYPGTISQSILDSIDLLVINDNFDASEAEIKLINGWINIGGSLLIDADSDCESFNKIIEGSGITFHNYTAGYGSAFKEFSHDVNNGIGNYLISSESHAKLRVSGSSSGLYHDRFGGLNSAIGYIGKGKVVAIADESLQKFLDYDGHLKLGMNAVNWLASKSLGWLELEVSNKNIPSETTDSVSVTIDTDGLIEGNYRADVYITSNDPYSNGKLVPVLLEVVGIPGITVDSTILDFGKVNIGNTERKTIKLKNTGTDTVFIHSIKCTSDEVKVNASASHLLVGEEQVLTLEFSPEKSGNVVGNISIISNAKINDTIMVEFSGYGMSQPVISELPGSIYVQLTAGDSVSKSVEMCNLGDYNLNWEFYMYDEFQASEFHGLSKYNSYANTNEQNSRGDSEVSYTGEIEILAWTYVTRLHNYNNLVKSIVEYNPNANVTQTRTLDPVVLSEELKAVDILLIPEQSDWSNNWFFYQFARDCKQVLTQFVKEGGVVIACGVDEHSDVILNSTGLMSAYHEKSSYGGLMQVVDSNHFVTYNVASNPLVSSGTKSYEIRNTDYNKLITHNSYVTAAARKLGRGGVVLLGHSFSYFGHDAAILVSNAVRWSEYLDKNWLITDHCSGTIHGKDSLKVNFKFNSKYLYAGRYKKNIKVISNDSKNSTDSITIILDVEGKPAVSCYPDSVHFDSVLLGQTVVDSIKIRNTGCDTLFISSVHPQDRELKVVKYPSYLLPGTQSDLVVMFKPNMKGHFKGGISLFTNDPDNYSLTVSCTGYGFSSPVMTITPVELKSVLKVNDIDTESLVIQNIQGVENLEWSLNTGN
ncbi:MAG: choice-of-anchor D domain-containing protein, partial [Bacteroidales bacterium]|nr:choice-of-anchor D domain-containing protein [Bacteroidales bacterium]